jgi:hypothetical protein
MRIALIGAGGISRAHTNAFPHFRDRVSLAAVCDTHEPAARGLAAECGVDIPVFTDYRQLLAQSKPDAAIITLGWERTGLVELPDQSLAFATAPACGFAPRWNRAGNDLSLRRKPHDLPDLPRVACCGRAID